MDSSTPDPAGETYDGTSLWPDYDAEAAARGATAEQTAASSAGNPVPDSNDDEEAPPA